MEYFTQKNSNLELVGGQSIANSLQQIPEPDYPKTGDKMLISFNPYGGVNLVDPKNPPTMAKIFEVEVTGEKKVQINIV